MKAIIPVAGVGTQLRPLTYTQPKPLILVAGKPIIGYIIDELTAIGIRDFVFVIGYLGEKIRNYIEETYPHINQEYVTQEQRKGSGHAIWTAADTFREEEEIVIFLGDTIIDADFQQMIDLPSSCLGVKKVDDPRQFGVVEYDTESQYVRRLIEKPRIPKSNMALVGFYKIKEVEALVEALDYNIKHDIRNDGEFPLTDALMRMVEQGVQMRTLPVDSWYDCGKQAVLLEINALLLDKQGYAAAAEHSYYNTVLISPVSIGKNCTISNSVIGPHVTIGDNAKIDSSIIKESIIGNYAAITETVLRNSIIGNDTSIRGFRHSFNIGDNAVIDFSTS